MVIFKKLQIWENQIEFTLCKRHFPFTMEIFICKSVSLKVKGKGGYGNL